MNNILTANLVGITKNIGFNSIVLLVASPWMIVVILSAALALSVISASLTLMTLNKIKPINIIKAKE